MTDREGIQPRDRFCAMCGEIVPEGEICCTVDMTPPGPDRYAEGIAEGLRIAAEIAREKASGHIKMAELIESDAGRNEHYRRYLARHWAVHEVAEAIEAAAKGRK